MRTVDILAQGLYAAGCRHAFGIPGGEVLALVDALHKAGIEFILAKHENSAGFMAEGVYHRTGAPGVLVATLGPGAMNGVNVVANAFQDKVPLIILTGCVDDTTAMTYTHQVMDHNAVFQSITKGTFRLTGSDVSVVINKALSTALNGRPGPVHIDLPISIAESQCEETYSGQPQLNQPAAPAQGPHMDRAVAALNDAERPLILAGLDVLNDEAGENLVAMAEHIGAPVITTYKAKGVISENHPLALGGAGLSPKADQHLLPLVRQADAIIAAGYDPIEMRAGWRNPWDPETQMVIELSAESNQHYMHQSTIHYTCNVAAGLQMLTDRLRPKNGWPDGAPAKIREMLRSFFASAGQWGPARVVEMAREIFPENAIATADSGAHRILQSQIWECYAPRTLLQSSGLCTMGCAVPLALGAKIADPQTPVVAFTGDAGLLMILGELATIVEVELPIVIIVFVDASLALIDLKQRNMGLDKAGVDIGHFNFAAIAKAVGGQGVCVRDERGLHDALGNALNAAEFTIIACEIDGEAYDGRF